MSRFIDGLMMHFLHRESPGRLGLLAVSASAYRPGAEWEPARVRKHYVVRLELSAQVATPLPDKALGMFKEMLRREVYGDFMPLLDQLRLAVYEHDLEAIESALEAINKEVRG